MSPALNGSSALERFECSNAIKIRNGIMFDFYPGLPQLYLIKIVWRPYILSLAIDNNCRQITRKQDLFKELADIGNWEALCTHLEVPEATLDGLVYAQLENTAKKQRCLAAYFDQGKACWEKVIEVVAGYPFYRKNLAKQIAEKYRVILQE